MKADSAYFHARTPALFNQTLFCAMNPAVGMLDSLADLVSKFERIFCVMKAVLTRSNYFPGWSCPAHGAERQTPPLAVCHLLCWKQAAPRTGRGLPAAFEATVTYLPAIRGLTPVADAGRRPGYFCARRQRRKIGSRRSRAGERQGSAVQLPARLVISSKCEPCCSTGLYRCPNRLLSMTMTVRQRDAIFVTVRKRVTALQI